VAGHVGDPTFLHLVEGVLGAGGRLVVRRWWWQRRCGLVQGAALSPLLCKLALHALDERLIELARQTDGGVTMLRYADDLLLLLGRDPRCLERGVGQVRATLARQFQALREAKPELRKLVQGVDRLSAGCAGDTTGCWRSCWRRSSIGSVTRCPCRRHLWAKPTTRKKGARTASLLARNEKPSARGTAPEPVNTCVG
jgi:hypothetical protein